MRLSAAVLLLLRPLLLLSRGSQHTAVVVAEAALGLPLFNCSVDLLPEKKGNSTVESGASVAPVPLCLSDERSLLPPLPATGHSVNRTVTVALTAQHCQMNLFPQHYIHGSLVLSNGFSLPANATTTAMWCFNGHSPGPVIRASVGDTLVLTLRNLLPASVGFFIPGVFNARDPIEGGFARPGATKVLQIPLTSAGTFRYFSSVDVATQVALGLHGVLVVTAAPDDAAAAAAPPAVGEVVVVSDPLLASETLQIVTGPILGPLERAELSYNGRRGNVLSVNGLSISNGYQVVWRESVKAVHFVNACSARTLQVEIPGLPLFVDSSWACGTQRQDRHDRSNPPSENGAIRIPPGGTADLIVDVPQDAAGKFFHLVVSDATILTELRQPMVQTEDESPSAETSIEHAVDQHDVVSITKTHSANDRFTSVVDLVMVPRLDGVVTDGGCRDASALGRLELGGDLPADFVVPVSPCPGGKCQRLVYGFALATVLPPDAEIVDASFVVEVVCGERHPRISAALWAVNDADTDAEGKPSTAVLNREEDTLPLGRAVVSCDGERHRNGVIDFSDPKFLSVLQAAKEEAMAWIALSLDLHLGDDQINNNSGSKVFAASRLASTLAPPSLRLLFKTKEANVVSAALPKTPAALVARQRQVERVFQELHGEQQSLKTQLHALYNRVKKRQRGGFRVQGGGKSSSKVISQEAQLQLDKVLEIHVQDQQTQSQLEKRLLKLNASTDIPLTDRKQMIAEIQKELEEFYLKQRQHNKELTALLQSMVSDESNTNEQKASEGAVELTEIEKRALKREKQLYVKLYRHYCSLVSEMKQLRETSNMLKRSASDPSVLRAAAAGEVFAMRPVSAPPSFFNQSLLHIQVAEHLTISAPHRLAPTRPRHSAGLVHVREGDRTTWTYRGGEEATTVTLRIGQSENADVSGHVPMWIAASIQLPVNKQLLQAGDWVVWEIVNPTLLSHTLYFHRALLEVFEVASVESEGSEVVADALDPALEHTNGHVYGLTVGAAPMRGGRTIMRALSVVPRIVPSRTQNFGLHQRPGSDAPTAVNWDVRVNSACREHSANGLTVRVRLEVEKADEQEVRLLLLAAGGDGVAMDGGIDYSNSDLFDEALESDGGRFWLLGSFVVGALLLSGVAGTAWYAAVSRKRKWGYRSSGGDTWKGYTEIRTPNERPADLGDDAVRGCSTAHSATSPERTKFLKRRPPTDATHTSATATVGVPSASPSPHRQSAGGFIFSP